MLSRLQGSYIACRNWLELHSRWSALRTLGQSNLVKASVLMPAFGYMLLLNDNVHQYLTIKYDGWLLQYLPSVWRVWILFYGSFLLALATLLYGVFCPADVKRYGTPYEKAETETQHVERLGGLQGLAKEYGEVYDALSKREDEIYPYAKMNLGNLNVDEPARLKIISKCLIHIWLMVNVRKPVLRGTIYALFAAGLSLIALPAIFTFAQVSWLALSHFL